MTGTGTEAALLEAMRVEAGDPFHRLAYADWLEEEGRSGEAEGVRWAVKRRKRPFLLYGGQWSWHDRSLFSSGSPCPKDELPHGLFARLAPHRPGGLLSRLLARLGLGRDPCSSGWSRDYPTRLEAELDLYQAYARWKGRE